MNIKLLVLAHVHESLGNKCYADISPESDIFKTLTSLMGKGLLTRSQGVHYSQASKSTLLSSCV